MTASNRVRRAAGTVMVAACAALWGSPAAAGTIDLGDPSVQSQQGQRLRVAVPYGSAPGEPVSASRFSVESIETPQGYRAPAADQFTVLKSARRNVVILQSDRPVDAPEVTLAVRVAGQPGPAQVFRLPVPQAKASPASVVTAYPTAVRPGGAAERKAQRAAATAAPLSSM